MQFPAHVVHFILKRVQGKQQARMYKVKYVAERRHWEVAYQHRLKIAKITNVTLNVFRRKPRNNENGKICKQTFYFK